MPGVYGADSESEHDFARRPLAPALPPVQTTPPAEVTPGRAADPRPRSPQLSGGPQHAIELVRGAGVQTAAAAATGFVAGAATLALVHRLGRGRQSRALGPSDDRLHLGSGNTYIVHVRVRPRYGPGAPGE